MLSTELKPITICNVNDRTDSSRGNFIAIQPVLFAHHFVSEEAYYNELSRYLFKAEQEGLLSESSVVVFPEAVGLWLVLTGAPPSALEVETPAEAITRFALHQPVRFAVALSHSRKSDPLREAAFRMQAESMAKVYHSVFSKLASQFKVTIVAGSTVLPGAHIRNGTLTVDSGTLLKPKPLEIVGAVYRPDGSPYPRLVRKVFLIEEEKKYTHPGKSLALPIFRLPIGRLAVLICADSWFPQNYSVLKERGVDFIAVPAYSMTDGLWSTLWGGYNGHPLPSSVDPTDVGKITEGDAWEKYALAGRIKEAGAKAGVTTYLRGQVYNIGSDGSIIAALENGNKKWVAPQSFDGLIANIWVG